MKNNNSNHLEEYANEGYLAQCVQELYAKTKSVERFFYANQAFERLLTLLEYDSYEIQSDLDYIEEVCLDKTICRALRANGEEISDKILYETIEILKLKCKASEALHRIPAKSSFSSYKDYKNALRAKIMNIRIEKTDI